MKLKILGCSGAVGGELRTTAMLLDHDVLLDAGTGVGDLELEEMSRIGHVFLTHAHLDHVAFLPFLLDSVSSTRDKPLTVYALPETLLALQQHIFNWHIWPDFTQIPDPSKPCLRYQALSVGETVNLDGRKITPLPANHVVPALAYRLDSGNASLVFSGDTTGQDDFWVWVNAIDNLRFLIMETAYSNSEKELARLSKHLYPDMLADELKKLRLKPEIYISHLKPDERELIMQEIRECTRGCSPNTLLQGQTFEF